MIATLYPDRIVTRWPKNGSPSTYWEEKMLRKYNSENKIAQEKNENSISNLQKKKETWQLSSQTKRKISNSISLLNHLSPPRTIWPKSKKPIYNFRTSFITLTLPSAQGHPDQLIKSKCLNNFLNHMRSKFGLKNYVWKAELQLNRSIHFHIVWDIYIHHSAVRYYWNLSLELLGYITEYQKRYSSMTLQDYAQHRQKPVSKVITAFRKGRDTSWRSPPTEQVVTVRNAATLASYLRKYMIKSEEDSALDDSTRIIAFGRTWSRSESLSKIEFIKHYSAANLLEYVATLGTIGKNLFKKTYDYVTIYYFNFKTATKAFLSWINAKMLELGTTYNYVPPD